MAPRERNAGRVDRRTVPRVDRGSVRRRHVVRVEDVLDADRDPVQRAPGAAAYAVESPGEHEHRLRIHVHPRPHRRVVHVDSLQECPRHRLDRLAAVLERPGELGDGVARRRSWRSAFRHAGSLGTRGKEAHVPECLPPSLVEPSGRSVIGSRSLERPIPGRSRAIASRVEKALGSPSMSLSTPPRAAAMLVAACALGLALAADASTATPSGKRQTTLRVGSAAGFDAAVRALRRSGGTIVLRPRLYRELVIGWRTGKRLRVVGMRGARVGRVVFDRSRHVSLGRVTIGPVRGDALLDVRDSRHIALHDLVVTARGTRFSASIRIPTRATSRSGAATSLTAVIGRRASPSA